MDGVIPVMQTRNGGPDSPPDQHGDCFAACVASILEYPIDAFESPSPTLAYEQWEQAWLAQLAPLGLWVVGIEVDPDDTTWWVSPGFWIASVPSLNIEGTDDDGMPIRHAVVMRGPALAHDPALGRRYRRVALREVLGCRWLVPVDPSTVPA